MRVEIWGSSFGSGSGGTAAVRGYQMIRGLVTADITVIHENMILDISGIRRDDLWYWVAFHDRNIPGVIIHTPEKVSNYVVYPVTFTAALAELARDLDDEYEFRGRFICVAMKAAVPELPPWWEEKK